jgi:hypothetical protein
MRIGDAINLQFALFKLHFAIASRLPLCVSRGKILRTKAQ